MLHAAVSLLPGNVSRSKPNSRDWTCLSFYVSSTIAQELSASAQQHHMGNEEMLVECSVAVAVGLGARASLVSRCLQFFAVTGATAEMLKGGHGGRI